LLLGPAETSESRFEKYTVNVFMSICWIGALATFLMLPKDLLFQYYNIGEKRINSQVEILYANEGVECITTVHRYPDGNRVISTGSINVAGTDFTLRTTQKLQAHIPMLLHPSPKIILQVGFGSGETSYLLTTYPTEQVDVVDISQGVFETSAKYFVDLNQNVINNSKFHAIVMDGANYVAVTDRKYDVIMNDSIWPFYSGNSGLYTYEYFQAGRAHLKPGGIMTSWLPLDMPEESLKSLLRTFQSVFPHVSLWMAVTHYNKHGLLVGSLEPLKIDVKQFLLRFNQFAREDLKLIHLDNPLNFLDAFKMNENGFQKWVNAAPLHTLDRPILEFAPRKRHAGRDLIRAYEWILYTRTDLEDELINIPQAGFSLDTLNDLKKATEHVMLGLVKREKGEEGYLPELKRALQGVPHHPGAQYLLDELEHLRNTDLIVLNSADFNTLLQLGETFLENDMLDKAMLTYDRADQINPNSAIVHYNLGVLHYRQGLLDEAITELNQALKLKPDYSPAFNIRGLLYYAFKNPDAAISDFNQALQLNPDDAQVINNRGIVQASQKNYQDALSDFSLAIELDPVYAQAVYNRGLVYQFGFQDLGLSENIAFSKALADYTAALQVDPDYGNAYNNRGMLYAQMGNYVAAISDFSQVILLFPEQADAYYNRGLAFQLSSNERQANVDFQKAIELNPAYQDIFNH
jgi:tetratricopeptide (TPR) repeat protein